MSETKGGIEIVLRNKMVERSWARTNWNEANKVENETIHHAAILIFCSGLHEFPLSFCTLREFSSFVIIPITHTLGSKYKGKQRQRRKHVPNEGGIAEE